MAAKANLAIILGVQGQNVVEGALKGIAGAAKSMVDGLGKIGLAGMGLSALTEGAKGLGDALGLGLNAEMENTRAKLNAFTKDAGLTETIMADLKKEAAATPFAFKDMASAAASLLPASKQAGVGLNDLIKQAEILAALNPQEGLEGAAFALKEALSGDFVSIVERFNLPRQRLMELKSQGVPAMKAISIAMKEMGIDASLVTNMGQTMTGRWSTLMDTFDTVRAEFSKPLFDMLSAGLGEVQPMLDAAMPAILAIARGMGEGLAGAFKTVGLLVQGLVEVFGGGEWTDALTAGLERIFGIDSSAADVATDIIWGLKDVFDAVMGILPDLVTGLQQAFSFFATGGGDIEKFRGLLNAALGPEATQGIIEVFTNLVGFFHQNVLPLIDGLVKAFQMAFQGDLPGALQQAWATLSRFGVQLVESLAVWGRRFIEWIAPMIPPFLLEVGKLGIAFLGWVAEQIPPLLALLAKWAQALWEWVGPMIPPFLAELGKLAVAFLKWAADQIPPLLAQLGKWAKEMVEWVGPLIPPLLIELGKVGLALLGYLGELAAQLWESVAGDGDGTLKTSLVNGLKAAVDAAVNALSNVYARLVEPFQKAWNKIRELLENIKKSVPGLGGDGGAGASATGAGGGGARGVGGTVITGNSVYVTAPDSRAAGYAAADGLASLARSRVLSGAL